MSGYNWRDTLGDFAALSGVLAGFTLALVVFILGWSIADQPLYSDSSITYGHVGVLLNGISSALFIASSEFFLMSKEHNVWALPDKYEEYLDKGFKDDKQDWQKIKTENLDKCLHYECRGRYCYNSGIYLIFIALLFVIGPYNFPIGLVVSGLGIGLEIYQMTHNPKKQ